MEYFLYISQWKKCLCFYQLLNSNSCFFAELKFHVSKFFLQLQNSFSQLCVFLQQNIDFTLQVCIYLFFMHHYSFDFRLEFINIMSDDVFSGRVFVCHETFSYFVFNEYCVLGFQEHVVLESVNRLLKIINLAESSYMPLHLIHSFSIFVLFFQRSLFFSRI